MAQMAHCPGLHQQNEHWLQVRLEHFHADEYDLASNFGHFGHDDMHHARMH
jgi:hypothetical protein